MSVEGRREVGVLAREGSGGCGTGQEFGGSDAEWPLAVVHPRTLPHSRAPVPSTCPASSGEDDGHVARGWPLVWGPGKGSGSEVEELKDVKLEG